MLDYGRPTRHKTPAMFLFLLLGLAVFLWGLQYKLSLYQSEAAQRAVPAAKLLSQKEWTLANAGKRSLVRGLFAPAVPRKKLLLAKVLLDPSVYDEFQSEREDLVATSVCDRTLCPCDRKTTRPRAPPITL